ncbi:MAG: COG1496: Uncharacterized conserved protein [uncultured Sulfurovum sp.]|uniref:Purine nucleoside phosphorylase n=1 Tax=uncultured Sulfurovum sp. TaxID=269237 RepID=A0A6S6SE60_9BACT|nr:MAG: COG1496: Uncharacterized conserved protein [uncultured Sulfurovum sp.]
MKKIYTFHKLSKYKSCHHLVTQKDQNSPYSFSLALHTNEEKKEIVKNRNEFSKYFPHKKFIVANQTHSSNICIVDKNEELGWKSLENAIENSDALITNQKDVMLTILTADCVPILLFDPINKVVAAVHAGWKGTKQEILFKTVEKMKKNFNSDAKYILAGIAPSIGRCCYEVDWNVAQHFKDVQNSYDKKADKYMLDLPYINKLQLLEAGLIDENIELSNVCTACEVDNYFSYRKENGCSGRFMSMIGLN